jgi:hypothetical protein
MQHILKWDVNKYFFSCGIRHVEIQWEDLIDITGIPENWPRTNFSVIMVAYRR